MIRKNKGGINKMIARGLTKVSKIAAALTMALAIVTVNSTCFFFSHQPDIPEKLKKKND